MLYSNFNTFEDALVYFKEHGGEVQCDSDCHYIVYVGSACEIGGVDGAATYFIFKDRKYLTHGTESYTPTTSNRMALMATINAMRNIPNGEKVLVLSPNRYGCVVFNVYNGTQDFKNKDLLDLYRQTKGERKMIYKWVKRKEDVLGCMVTSLMSLMKRKNMLRN